ncbi:IPExxxVDY family protein [Belliella kenyensis]|uniref:IPExxxVDY family protein n=1 Tax=Belliella kenyensis TaxID=1472724 RepID=A0ABV8EJZ8_9BACT|nr:IPExxxVDY family protein [Belliella kenyensis]MCH7402954.1 IPExxxVDY family protein [Belliella kenyensis]MDN3604990.1 IPExxxVDY family protein [Belliella kenyensis]
MKKTKLLVDNIYDFELLGFIAPLKDYKMAWVINNCLDMNLVKSKDFELQFLDDTAMIISQYMIEKEHGYVQLLKNRSVNQNVNVRYLIPELKIMDYFLLIQDYTEELDINLYIERLSKSNLIQNVVKLDVNKIKSKENLLTY